MFESAPTWPPGLAYRPDFLCPEEEAGLLRELERLPFQAAMFQQFTARRRVVRYGEGEYAACYGKRVDAANPRRPFPAFLHPVRARIAQWLGMDEAAFVHALCTEYAPGTPIGWHSDAPQFGIVVGLSLAGAARMRFRPCAPARDKAAAFELDLAPRSAYVMRDEARWRWQHHIPPTRTMRYSITLRTLHADSPAPRPTR